jgi:TonB family protein
LDARRKPSAAAIKARGSRRKSSPALLAALALLLIGAGFYAGWTMKPGFRAAVLRDYGKLRQLITRTGTSLQTTASAPKAVPQQVLPQTAAAAKPAKTSAKASRAVPSNTPVAEGFLSAQDKSAQGSEGNDTANNAAASSVLLPTSAAQDSNGDRGPLVVAAELADQHVGHRVAPFYPEPARRKRLEGDVVLRVAVNDDGSVDSVQVLDGDARLVAAAVEAVRQWRYDLYYHNGQPSAFQTEVTVRFALPKKGAR